MKHFSSPWWSNFMFMLSHYSWYVSVVHWRFFSCIHILYITQVLPIIFTLKTYCRYSFKVPSLVHKQYVVYAVCYNTMGRGRIWIILLYFTELRRWLCHRNSPLRYCESLSYMDQIDQCQTKTKYKIQQSENNIHCTCEKKSVINKNAHQ